MVEIDGRALAWADIEVPGFAPGLKIAALTGDPAAANQPYALRLKFPDGYTFPAHWHPMAENLTVVSETFYLGMGKTAGEGKSKRYVAGDFLFIPAKMSHYGGVRGETVVRLHGLGPFEIYVTETSPPE